MPHFEDYHRTVIGYHGTRRSLALRIVQGLEPLDFSRNPGDWLGHGVYFREYAPQQTWPWAEAIRRARRWDDVTAVLGGLIRLVHDCSAGAGGLGPEGRSSRRPRKVRRIISWPLIPMIRPPSTTSRPMTLRGSSTRPLTPFGGSPWTSPRVRR
ncbi:MAG TPA: hypothetical protein VG406_08025 [Isosphaeraceae bacterium]|nr:hypothetical protein [Isosphaeraceae bacterium]